jgi:tetratricopeptide (TPR) repeat protein
MKRGLSGLAVLVLCLAAASGVMAQSPAAGNAAASSQNPNSEAQKPSAPSPSSANPFPEDTSSVPVLPTRETISLPGGNSNTPADIRFLLSTQDTDPVRSPDDPAPDEATQTQEAYSSSLKGTENFQPPADSDDKPGKRKILAVKEPTHQEAASKDIEVGSYYLDKKNWRAALSRFQSAMVLDPENPEVYWGLAEAERSLGDLAGARVHYLKLLDFDPDGPHGKQARKALKDPALAGAPRNAVQQPAAPQPAP